MGRAHGFLGLLVAACCIGSAAAQTLEPGDAAPDALGRTRAGTEVTLTSHRGKVVAVSFWASWCAPCWKELPMLDRLQRVVGPERLRVIAVNIEEREMFRRVTSPMVDWSIVFTNDPYKDQAQKYGVGPIPHLVIVGRDGKVRQVFKGYAEEGLPTVVGAVAGAINE